MTIPRRNLGVLLLACSILLIAGLVLPVLTVEKLVLWESTFSIVSGVWALAREGNVWLAAILFFFSITFPIAKLVALWLVWAGEVSGRRRERLLAGLRTLGKWSMLDVFVVAVTVVAVKLGALATAHPRGGILAFAAAVVLSMIATSQVDRPGSRPTR